VTDSAGEAIVCADATELAIKSDMAAKILVLVFLIVLCS
jgi:hypothetical protein